MDNIKYVKTRDEVTGVITSGEYMFEVDAHNVVFEKELESGETQITSLVEEMETKTNVENFGTDKISVGRIVLDDGKIKSVEGKYSIVFGTDSAAAAEYTVAIGQSLLSSTPNAFNIGRYNKYDSEGKYLFIIGNGSDESEEGRSNAMMVDSKGNVFANNFYNSFGQLISPSIESISINDATYPCNGGNLFFKSGKNIKLTPSVTESKTENGVTKNSLVITIDSTGGGGGTGTVDTEIDEKSKNPVENQAIAKKFNEVFTSVSNGKKLIAEAITDKGVETSAIATFSQMANNIEKIHSGGESKQDPDGISKEIFWTIVAVSTDPVISATIIIPS